MDTKNQAAADMPFRTDAVILSGNAQATLALSNVAAQTAALTGGLYDVWCTTDCYIKVAGTANDVTTANGYLIRVGNIVPIIVPNGEKIGGILSSGTGTLSYHKVN